MIDLIDVTIRLRHDGKVNNGYKVSRKKDGLKNKRYFCIPVAGVGARHNEMINVVSFGKNHLRIIGSPLNFLQGQNVFGSDDLCALVCQVAINVTERLGIIPSEKNIKSWQKGWFEVHRLDITYNFLMPSRASVVDWLNQAGLSCSAGKQRVDTIRSSSSHDFETIVMGKTSDFISVKFYDKYKQLLAKKGLHAASANLVKAELLDYSKRLLRCEIRLNAKYLREHRLTRGKVLTADVLQLHYFNKLQKLSFGSSTILPKSHVADLTKSESLLYEAWLCGVCLKHSVSESTWFRLAKKLEPHGVDIRRKLVKKVSEQELASYLLPSNIADTPKFLMNTPWLYKPKPSM